MSKLDEFYIGYEQGMPAGMRRMVLGTVAAAAAAAAIVTLIFVSQQRALAESRFEFGHVRTFTGYLALSPAPVLLVSDDHGVTPHWLVARGKLGAAAAIGNIAPGWFTLEGSLIQRESWRMIEVRAGSPRPHAGSAPPGRLALTGARRVVARGEIVDSKCFLGVMNPGERTVHRDCAVRCLDGGIPPMFAFHDTEGSHLALLVGAREQWLLKKVGRAVTLSGVVSGPEESLVFAVAADSAH